MRAKWGQALWLVCGVCRHPSNRPTSSYAHRYFLPVLTGVSVWFLTTHRRRLTEIHWYYNALRFTVQRWIRYMIFYVSLLPLRLQVFYTKPQKRLIQYNSKLCEKLMHVFCQYGR